MVAQRKKNRENEVSEPDRNREVLEMVRRYPEAKRNCMRCRRAFTSTGPHHRMCNDCRREA